MKKAKKEEIHQSRRVTVWLRWSKFLPKESFTSTTFIPSIMSKALQGYSNKKSLSCLIMARKSEIRVFWSGSKI